MDQVVIAIGILVTCGGLSKLVVVLHQKPLEDHVKTLTSALSEARKYFDLEIRSFERELRDPTRDSAILKAINDLGEKLSDHQIKQAELQSKFITTEYFTAILEQRLAEMKCSKDCK